MYEAFDSKNSITSLCTMPAPHCSVVFGCADSALRFIDPRKPGLQVPDPQINLPLTFHEIFLFLSFKCCSKPREQ